jgi:shikimate kinase
MSRDAANTDAPVRLVITGFMGAGKTTIARSLGARLGCAVLDMDEFISAREGREPQRIIDEDGEPAFRDVETRALKDALAQTRARVIALGGGAWTINANRDLIAQHGCFTIWLDAPFELCWQRIFASGNARPLARDEHGARQLYERRRETYALADLRVRVTAGKLAEEMAEEIARVSGADAIT